MPINCFDDFMLFVAWGTLLPPVLPAPGTAVVFGGDWPEQFENPHTSCSCCNGPDAPPAGPHSHSEQRRPRQQ
jgi:hypothetical protein